ncbi:polysaccharide deacetylase, partial [Medicago truncatula]
MPGVQAIAGVMGNDEERVDFRPGSTLLIVAGCFNDDCDYNDAKAARFFYEWTGTRLRRVGTCPLAIEPRDFDDGPGPSTPLLLDVLHAASCRATFFLLGRNLAGALDVAARMAREGHRLGNHTRSHAKPGTLSDDALIDEIETTDALIRDAYREAR